MVRLEISAASVFQRWLHLENGIDLDFYLYMADYGKAHTSAVNQNSTLSNLAVCFPVTDDLKLTLSYQLVGGDTEYSYGWGGNDDHYLMVWNSIQYSGFSRKDEKSYQIRADYKTPIEGLSLMARHTQGSFDSADSDQSHKETDLDATYAVQSLEGLNLRAHYARIRVETGGEDINEVRLIANYTF